MHNLFSVIETINMNLKIDLPRSITLLGENTAVVCTAEAGKNVIKSYDIQTGKELSYVYLSLNANGLAEVKLGEKLALAVARRFVKILNVGIELTVILQVVS